MKTLQVPGTDLTVTTNTKAIILGRRLFSSRPLGQLLLVSVVAFGGLAAPGVSNANTPADEDQKIVAALDTEYQAAVKRNDADTMDRLLADDFVLVAGSGSVHTKADLLKEARSGRIHFEQQNDGAQTVRIWGDTAVITARLWEKGTDDGKPFDYTLWFSDTYIRTPAGWRYVFGQASLPLPKTSR